MKLDLSFQYPHPPTTDEAIADYEKELGFRLPEDYRQFLLKYNGGDAPNRRKFAYKLINGNPMVSSIETFFGLGLEENHIDIRRNQRTTQRIQGQPSYFFIIGYALGSIVGIGITEDTFGKIYVWENTVSDDIIFVAKSFNEFLDTLRDNEGS
jgi:cell wall assembly regulator SMI1